MDVTVLATGGTIASTGGEAGAAPSLTGEELVEAVPQLADHADLTVEEVAQVPGFEVDAETLEAVGDRVAELDADPGVDAVVVTHGTDTLEETAYYLDAAVRPATPTFVTGAQRRPDEPSADGAANLIASVRAARAFQERGSGAFVVFDQEVHAAKEATKAHTSSLDAFRSVETGPVAAVGRDGVVVHRPPQSETDHLPARSLDAFVPVVSSGTGAPGTMVEAAVDRGADGLVVAGTGLGNVTKAMGEAIESAVEEIPIVVTSRCLGGRTGAVYGSVGGGVALQRYGAVFAGSLPAQKARLKLQLALAAYEERDEIEGVFETAHDDRE